MNMQRPHYVTDEVLHHFINNALQEDIQDGDHSTLATIPSDLVQSAQLLVKQDCILAGVELAKIIFRTFDSEFQIETFINNWYETKVYGIKRITTIGSR